MSAPSVPIDRPVVVRGAPGTVKSVDGPRLRDWIGPVARAVAVRPGLWPTALRQTGVLARPGWWRRRPWLPVPDPDYFRFRLVTQYGDPDHAPEPADVVAYLHWCRSYRAALR